MASSLRNTLQELAASFASEVLEALRGMSLEDILTATRGGIVPPSAADGVSQRGKRRDDDGISTAPRAEGRLPRRSADAIGEVVTRIVELLATHPHGLRSEQIRDALGLRANEMPRPLKEGLAQNRIVKEGEKRATTYFAAKPRGKAKSASSSGKRRGPGKRAGGAGPGPDASGSSAD